MSFVTETTRRTVLLPSTTVTSAFRIGYPARQLEGYMGHLATLPAITAVAMCSGAASAAEVKLVGSPGVRGVIEQLAPKFQAKTGHTVVGDFEVIAKIKSRIDRGEHFAIAVLSPCQRSSSSMWSSMPVSLPTQRRKVRLNNFWSSRRVPK
jgi:hypothetical protein